MPERRNIAIVLSRFPYPLDKGDKLRAFHQLTYLSRTTDVHLFALCERQPSAEALEALQPYCHSIHLYPISRFTSLWGSLRGVLKKQPLQVGYFYSSALSEKLRKDIMEIRPDVVFGQLTRTALYLKDLPFRKIMDYQDAFSINYKRMAAQTSGWRKWVYRFESTRMANFEQNMLKWFDEVLIISEFDRQQIETAERTLHVIPNGVDASYFTPMQVPAKWDVFFSGNMGYMPNRQAVDFLMQEVMPRLLQVAPGIKAGIAGRDGERFTHYRNAGTDIYGWQPDIRPFYAASRIMVAPLFTGAGLQNKLLEAMSMGIPCITTSVANASLRAIPGEQVLVADHAEDFVKQIRLLLHDETLHQKLAIQGKAFVLKQYTWEAANQQLAALLFPSC